MENKKNVNKREESCSYGSSLAGELQQGKEFARQLQMMFHNETDAPPQEAREYFVHQIIASFDRAVSIAHQTEVMAPSPPPHPLLRTKSESSLSGEDSDPIGDLHESLTRSRAAQPRWKTTMQVSPETGFEGPPGDGYNWRKYGQKEILHADYPRAYYKCALKNQKNCTATKQVQRCGNDPSTFEVTYIGVHTCTHPTAPSSSHPNPSHDPGLDSGSGPGKETLISFNQSNNPSCFMQLPPNPNQPNPNNNSFQFGSTSSGPTGATSAAGATSSASATSSTADVVGDFPFDRFDFDALDQFFH